MIKIPKQFSFAGIIFKVEIVDTVKTDSESDYGIFDTNQNTIKLAKYIDGETVTEQTMENTFYHELAHALQYYYNNELDESFAQCIGNFLMEYNHTKLYGETQ